VWENNRRLNQISAFLEDLATYNNNTEQSWMAESAIEKPAAIKARALLNMRLDDVGKIVAAAGIGTVYTWSPPPVVGGYVRDIDLFLNLFNLGQFQVGLDVVRDLLIRAHGVYDRNRRPAFWRTINPFTYVGYLLEWIASLPFRLLGRAGFNSARVERSLFGRLFKLLIEAVVVLAALATVLEFVGWTDKVRAVLKPYIG
jgi:hypothetical protein